MSPFFASGGQSIGVSASTSVLPNEYSGQISFRMDWLDLLAVQVTLKNLLQHHSSKASILRYLAFFMLDYMDLCWQMMSLFFNMLSRFVIAFLPRSKPLLISWLQSLPAVILEPQENKYY